MMYKCRGVLWNYWGSDIVEPFLNACFTLLRLRRVGGGDALLCAARKTWLLSVLVGCL